MGNVVVGPMFRKSIVRDLAGNIIEMLDETDGGYIIRNRQVVNQEKWDAYVQKEQDKKEAAKAVTMQKVDPNAPDRTNAPSQIGEVQKELETFKEDVNKKFDLIMEALKK